MKVAAGHALHFLGLYVLLVAVGTSVIMLGTQSSLREAFMTACVGCFFKTIVSRVYNEVTK